MQIVVNIPQERSGAKKSNQKHGNRQWHQRMADVRIHRKNDEGSHISVIRDIVEHFNTATNNLSMYLDRRIFWRVGHIGVVD